MSKKAYLPLPNICVPFSMVGNTAICKFPDRFDDTDYGLLVRFKGFIPIKVGESVTIHPHGQVTKEPVMKEIGRAHV